MQLATFRPTPGSSINPSSVRGTPLRSTLFAASVTYIIPVTAIGWGIYDGENVNGRHLVFIAVILGGVWLVNSKKKAIAVKS
jgi:drug/metabolite transporter (DMT)-like permease